MNSFDLKELLAFFDTVSTRYLEIKSDNDYIILSKNADRPHQVVMPEKDEGLLEKVSVDLASDTATEHKEEATEQERDMTEVESDFVGEAITSPLVGIVYLAPAPDQPPFVQVGDTIQQGDVVCIVEAMKVMNEVKSPYSGVVRKCHVENETMVEFGEPLFEIEVK